MKILEVASGLPNWGGTELHLINLSEQLRLRGHEVDVLCRKGSYIEAEAHRRSLPYVNAACDHQSDITAFPRLLSVIKRGGYDIVHVHWSPDYIVAPLAARAARVPVVLMSHHSPHPMKKGAIRQYLWKNGLFTHFIALSDSVRRRLLGDGLPPDRVTTIHHGTDIDAFIRTTLMPAAVRREWGVHDDCFLVGIAGRVAEEKGIDDFVAAIDLLRDLPVRGVVIGDGVALNEIRADVVRRRLETHIVFAGFRSDVNNAINALDALVLASTWAEPCAAVIQQAMALSKPVLGTDIGGTPEMIASEETGLLVPPGDPEALATAIRRLVSDPGLVERLGEAASVRVRDRFSQTHMVDRIETLYREGLEAGNQGRPARRKPIGGSL